MTARDRFGRTAVSFLLLTMLAVSGCATGGGARAGLAGPAKSVAPAPIKIGTVAAPDSLPLWIAQENGYFTDAGVKDVQIDAFQSAQDLETAFTAGSIDAMTGDIIVAAGLHASGTPVVLPMVLLGAAKDEGRFAIVEAPDQQFESMADLKGVPVGAPSRTVSEYVLYGLMDQAGVSPGYIKKQEVGSSSVGLQLLMSGQLRAASLPEPFVSLAEQQGARVVPGGDDTQAKQNLSCTVLCVSRKYAGTAGGAATVRAMLKAWDRAVADIDAKPDSFRETLVSRAGVPQSLAAGYPVSRYPKAQAPSVGQIKPVLDWMQARRYLTAKVTPGDLLP